MSIVYICQCPCVCVSTCVFVWVCACLSVCFMCKCINLCVFKHVCLCVKVYVKFMCVFCECVLVCSNVSVICKSGCVFCFCVFVNFSLFSYSSTFKKFSFIRLCCVCWFFSICTKISPIQTSYQDLNMRVTTIWNHRTRMKTSFYSTKKSAVK